MCNYNMYSSISGQLYSTLTLLLLIGPLVSCQLQQTAAGSGERGTEERDLQEIHFLVLLSFKIPGSQEQPLWDDGPNLLPVAELAVEQINQRKDILRDYTISLHVANSACDLTTHTVVNFVKSFFHSGVHFAGIVGPTCSDATELVSAITGESDTSILNFHIASSPQLSNRIRHGYSFGTAVSTHSIVGLFLHLMKQNDWRSVAVLYEESKVVYKTAYSLLVDELPQVFSQGKIVFSVPISATYLPLSLISSHHVRVIVVLSSADLMRRVLCLISKVFPQLRFPAYQFVTTALNFYYPMNFTFNNRRYVCSVKETAQAMEGFLFGIRDLLVDNSTVLVSGTTYKEYIEKYQDKANRNNVSTTAYANVMYDAIWSLALALNISIPKLNSIGLNLSDYTYGHQDATNIIRNEVVRLKFHGASGNISFNNKTGYTSSTVTLYQFIDNANLIIGYYSNSELKELEIIGSPKFVENTFKSEELLVHPALAALFLILTTVALILITTAHILTLVYHNYISIRASSYRLGQLSFIGCYILTIFTVSFTVQNAIPTTSVNTTSLCVIQAWCLPLGFTLLLGTVSAKTWMLYQIFVHLKKPGKFLTDWMLIVVVLALAGVDIVLCTVWTAAFRFTTPHHAHEMITGSNEIKVKVKCDSDSYFVWFGILTAYQGLIMFTALTLALLTRKIRHTSFRTNAVTRLVYFLTITLLLGVPMYYVLLGTHVSEVNGAYAVLSLTITVVLYLCFVFLFFPPILSLLREKLFHRVPGLKMFSKSSSNASRPSIIHHQP